MALTSLSQIKGGVQLKQNVEALLQSYQAAKVVTTITNKDNQTNYNVDELLKELRASLAQLQGSSSNSIDDLDKAIKAIANKSVKDIVRVEIPVVSGAAQIPADLDDKVKTQINLRHFPFIRRIIRLF